MSEITVTLSRRNLLALLSKLERNRQTPGSSRCTIVKPDGTVVRAEEDEVHYAARRAGQMHPIEEKVIAALAEGVEG